MMFCVRACGLAQRILLTGALAGAALLIDDRPAAAEPDAAPARVTGGGSGSGAVSVQSGDDSSDMSFSASFGGIADLISRMSGGDVTAEEFELEPSSTGDAARLVLPTPTAEPRFDIWVEGSRKREGPDWDRALSGSIFVGADYKLSPAITAGALAGREWVAPDKAAGREVLTSGPYLRVRLMPNLFASGLAAWDRETAAADAYPFAGGGSGEAERRRLRGDLTGDWQSGAWRFKPSLVYQLESPAKAAPLTAPVAGALSFGPALSYRHERRDGDVVEPRLAITGEWEGIALPGASTGPGPLDSLDAKLEGGVAFKDAEGWSLDASTSLSGIEDPQAEKEWSGRVGVKVPLN
ncbi:MAG: hypothetical protein MI824_08245 [Hyphomicrobiales bacterium]|nr:hypothetical protein [Hyphomicrobiales bacterium]